jgi:hypothetical protein
MLHKTSPADEDTTSPWPALKSRVAASGLPVRSDEDIAGPFVLPRSAARNEPEWCREPIKAA